MATDTPTRDHSEKETDGVVIKESPLRIHKRNKGSYVSLQRELIIRLNHLKAEAHQVAEAYLANFDGDVSTLVEFLDGSSEVRRPKDVKATTMEEWTKALDALSVKPHKGRRKDLRRIDRAVQAMMRNAFE